MLTLTVAGAIAFLLITVYAAATVADLIPGHYSHLLILAVYLCALIVGNLYFRPLAIAITVLLWGGAGLLLIRDWRAR